MKSEDHPLRIPPPGAGDLFLSPARMGDRISVIETPAPRPGCRPQDLSSPAIILPSLSANRRKGRLHVEPRQRQGQQGPNRVALSFLRGDDLTPREVCRRPRCRPPIGHRECHFLRWPLSQCPPVRRRRRRRPSCFPVTRHIENRNKPQNTSTPLLLTHEFLTAESDPVAAPPTDKTAQLKAASAVAVRSGKKDGFLPLLSKNLDKIRPIHTSSKRGDSDGRPTDTKRADVSSGHALP